MTKFEFALVVEGFDFSDDAQLDALYDHFPLVGANVQGGRTTIDMVVEASGAWAALTSSVEQLERVLPSVRVLRLDRDLVAMSDIAARLDRSAESVRLLVEGKRGPGEFPTPAGILGGGTRVWEWANVVSWLEVAGISVEGFQLIDHEMATLFDAHLLNRYGSPTLVMATTQADVESPRRVRKALLVTGLNRRALVGGYDSIEAGAPVRRVSAGDTDFALVAG